MPDQKDDSSPPANVERRFPEPTHAQLEGPIVPPPPLIPVTNHRHAFTTWAAWGVAHHQHIHYAEVRPIPIHLAHGHLPFTTDCSGFVTLMAKWAGCPDPNGRHFDGQGYTGTLLEHCAHVPPLEAKPGDLIVYGPGTGEHVVVIVGVGPDGVLVHEHGDFRVVSHGREGDPIVTSHSIEARAHDAPSRYLRWLP